MEQSNYREIKPSSPHIDLRMKMSQGLTVLNSFFLSFNFHQAHHTLHFSLRDIQRRRRTEKHNRKEGEKELDFERGIAVFQEPRGSMHWRTGLRVHRMQCNIMVRLIIHRSRGSVWSMMTWPSDTSASDRRLHLSSASTK
jgi:hypothetical protein